MLIFWILLGYIDKVFNFYYMFSLIIVLLALEYFNGSVEFH